MPHAMMHADGLSAPNEFVEFVEFVVEFVEFVHGQETVESRSSCW